MPIDEDQLSSVTYVASHHPATINSASRVFSHVDRVEREGKKKRQTSVANIKIPEEDVDEHQTGQKHRQMREMGTDYDPPAPVIKNRNRAVLEDNDEHDNKDNDFA